METFPIVKRKDEKAFGEYRTKRLILEIYDQMAEAERTGRPYRSRIGDVEVTPSTSRPRKYEENSKPSCSETILVSAKYIA